MTAAFRVEVLGDGHAREGFTCGVEVLDSYFVRQATQDVRRRASACFVAVEASSRKVAAYYTLAAGGVPLTELSDALAKRLPRYPSVPVARVGRLAVVRAFHGQKLGGALLADAAVRAIRSEVAVFALVVDAKDDAAEAFYRHHGFEAFGAKGRQLIVSLKHFAPAAE
ncbi:MAG: GNAT family N-acetyltransferase [Burkholderiaceae bacterium]